MEAGGMEDVDDEVGEDVVEVVGKVVISTIFRQIMGDFSEGEGVVKRVVVVVVTE